MACGCIDAAEHAGYRGAWPLLKRVTDLVHPRLPEKALTREEQIARKMRRTNDESYTIPENQLLDWLRSATARSQTIGEQFPMDASCLYPLATEKTALLGFHASSKPNHLMSGVYASPWCRK